MRHVIANEAKQSVVQTPFSLFVGVFGDEVHFLANNPGTVG